MTLSIPGVGSVDVPEAVGQAICGGDASVADTLALSLGVSSSAVLSAFAVVCPKADQGGPGLVPTAPAVPRWVWVAGGAGLLWFLWGRK